MLSGLLQAPVVPSPRDCWSLTSTLELNTQFDIPIREAGTAGSCWRDSGICQFGHCLLDFPSHSQLPLGPTQSPTHCIAGTVILGYSREVEQTTTVQISFQFMPGFVAHDPPRSVDDICLQAWAEGCWSPDTLNSTGSPVSLFCQREPAFL